MIKIRDELQRLLFLRCYSKDTGRILKTLDDLINPVGKLSRLVKSAKSSRSVLVHAFLELAVQYGVGYYIRAKVAEDRSILRSTLTHPLLYHALCSRSNTPFGADPQPTVRLLLEHKSNPNEAAWTRRLTQLYERRKGKECVHLEAQICQEIEMLLRCGANPDTIIKMDGTHKRRVKTREIEFDNTPNIEMMIKVCYPDRAEPLLAVLHEEQGLRRRTKGMLGKFRDLVSF
ncbi:MAG: hypothetical protein M1820_004459 [Bogoriella megaspora]|nr:MAG: hypothetical protein M1820_004459 [Bogoriella megaspora]